MQKSSIKQHNIMLERTERFENIFGTVCMMLMFALGFESYLLIIHARQIIAVAALPWML